MEYTIHIIPKAEKEFLKLAQTERIKIRNKILTLEKDPRPFGSKKLRETEYFRIRVGDYRIIYSVDDEHRLVKVLSIANRKDVYR